MSEYKWKIVINPALASETGNHIKTGVLSDLSELAAEDAKRNAPVDTGRLRESITASVDGAGTGVEGLVVAEVPYAGYQEFGTIHNEPQSFLRKALLALRGHAR